ncbi:Aste57867_1199 [Aphanomyces stellatus]|uniref:Aste57867_1199 protein n=1 Tax=Aphanomyces stellatus TaxID=120398 RepID=A0A485K4S4_9STRA|nr:hypothetical protein As57867_001198 [Aphanomyces stellatus]VFT78419.1 Aste57867_1199 [Aphanomyces stellatus]
MQSSSSSEQCFVKATSICCYGLYKHNGTCRRENTLASLAVIEYNLLRGACLALGLAALCTCVRKLYQIQRLGGSTIQKQVYSFLVLASLTFVVRAPDPWSYGHLYPALATGLLSDMCTGSLVSVLILYTTFYARLVVPPPRLIQSDHYIRGFMALAFTINWFVFFVVQPAYLLWDDSHIFRSWHLLVQFAVAPLLVLVVSTTAFVFGVQVYRRLSSIRKANERSAAIDTLRTRAAATTTMYLFHDVLLDAAPPVLGTLSPAPILLGSFEEVDHMETDAQLADAKHYFHPHEAEVAFRPTSDWRVLKVTLVVEASALVSIGFWGMLVTDFVLRGCHLQRQFELAARDRTDTPTFALDMPYFSILQFGAIVGIYWCFSKTKTPTAALPADGTTMPSTRGLARS